MGKNEHYHLIEVQGIEAADMEVVTNSNVLYDGSRLVNQRIGHRNIVLDIEYDGPNKLDAREKIIRLFNAHNTCQTSVRYGDSRKKILGFVESLKSLQKNIHNMIRFRLSIICPDPYFLDYDDRNIHLVEWERNLTFPLKIPQKRGLVFGKKKNRSFVNIINTGHIKTGMIITIRATGKVNKPFIMNTVTRKMIKINKNLTPGEVFIINTNSGQKGLEMLNDPEGRNNGYRFLSEDSEFLQLDLGDNLIRYGAEDGINQLSVIIQYNDKYLGV